MTKVVPLNILGNVSLPGLLFVSVKYSLIVSAVSTWKYSISKGYLYLWHVGPRLVTTYSAVPPNVDISIQSVSTIVVKPEVVYVNVFASPKQVL